MIARTVVPAPVTLRGMPAPRFWELEDALLDLGALQPGGTDLTQLLMIETVTRLRQRLVRDPGRPAGRQPGHDPVAGRDRHVRRRDAAAPERRPAVADCSGWNMFQLAMPFDAGCPGPR